MRNSLLVLLMFFFLLCSESTQEQQRVLPLHMKLKTFLTNVQSYFFPPNLEGSVSSDEPTVVAGGGGAESGAGEKVKEAVVKSLGEGKATVEETAKTAAQKLKDTFATHHEPEEDL